MSGDEATFGGRFIGNCQFGSLCSSSVIQLATERYELSVSVHGSSGALIVDGGAGMFDGLRAAGVRVFASTQYRTPIKGQL